MYDMSVKILTKKKKLKGQKMLNGLHGYLRQMEHEIKLNIQPTKTNK